MIDFNSVPLNTADPKHALVILGLAEHVPGDAAGGRPIRFEDGELITDLGEIFKLTDDGSAAIRIVGDDAAETVTVTTWRHAEQIDEQTGPMYAPEPAA